MHLQMYSYSQWHILHVTPYICTPLHLTSHILRSTSYFFHFTSFLLRCAFHIFKSCVAHFKSYIWLFTYIISSHIWHLRFSECLHVNVVASHVSLLTSYDACVFQFSFLHCYIVHDTSYIMYLLCHSTSYTSSHHFVIRRSSTLHLTCYILLSITVLLFNCCAMFLTMTFFPPFSSCIFLSFELHLTIFISQFSSYNFNLTSNILYFYFQLIHSYILHGHILHFYNLHVYIIFVYILFVYFCTFTSYMLTPRTLASYTLTFYMFTSYMRTSYMLTSYMWTSYMFTSYVLMSFMLSSYMLTSYMLTPCMFTLFYVHSFHVHILHDHILHVYIFFVQILHDHILHDHFLHVNTLHAYNLHGDESNLSPWPTWRTWRTRWMRTLLSEHLQPHVRWRKMSRRKHEPQET